MLGRSVENPVFIVDCMLGRLAKWLRVLGFAAHYSRDIQDDDLIQASRIPGHILLTRDTGLIKRSDIGPYLFIGSDCLQEQLGEVFRSLSITLDPDKFLTRCLSCNGSLESIPGDMVQGKVPDFIFTSHRLFSKCKECGKIYWQGSHRRKIDKMIGGFSLS